MRKFYNGQYTEMSPEEISEGQKHAAKLIAKEKNRPMTEGEALSLLLSRKIQEIDTDNNTALRMKAFYPVWEPGKDYAAGFKLNHKDRLYSVVQAHTSQSGWEPEMAPALFMELNGTYAGTLEDPIPYSGNQTLEKGKYYFQGEELYLCIRDTENPVYHELSELVGQYVEIV